MRLPNRILQAFPDNPTRLTLKGVVDKLPDSHESGIRMTLGRMVADHRLFQWTEDGVKYFALPKYLEELENAFGPSDVIEKKPKRAPEVEEHEEEPPECLVVESDDTLVWNIDSNGELAATINGNWGLVLKPEHVITLRSFLKLTEAITPKIQDVEETD